MERRRGGAHTREGGGGGWMRVGGSLGILLPCVLARGWSQDAPVLWRQLREEGILLNGGGEGMHQTVGTEGTRTSGEVGAHPWYSRKHVFLRQGPTSAARARLWPLGTPSMTPSSWAAEIMPMSPGPARCRYDRPVLPTACLEECKAQEGTNAV